MSGAAFGFRGPLEKTFRSWIDVETCGCRRNTRESGTGRQSSRVFFHLAFPAHREIDLMADNDSPWPRDEPRSSDSDDDEIRLSEIRELISNDGSKNVLHRVAQFGSISRRLMEAGNNDVYHRRIDMNQKSLAVAVLIATLAVGLRADAGMVNFGFSGAGVSGSGILTFGADTVANDPIGAYAISGISGSFTDAALNIKNEAITGIVAIAPGPYQGTPFPASLTVLTTTGLESSISYDNLFYPGGSPVTCATYPGAGGFLDIYGVLFTLANGDSVDLWSTGTFPMVHRSVMVSASSTQI